MPHRTTFRRAGATTAVVGLVLSFAAVTTSSIPAGAAPVDSPICNNQKPDQPNCVGDDQHGTLTAEVQSDGDLLFSVTPSAGFGGWSGVKLCIPGEPMTTSADCTGEDKDTLVSPSDYAMGGVTGAVASGVGYTFDCDATFSMRVGADALGGDPTPSYTVHLSPCAGGTDEAFGTAEAFSAPAGSTTTTAGPTTTTTTAGPTTTTTTTAPTTTTTTEATTTTTARSSPTPTESTTRATATTGAGVSPASTAGADEEALPATAEPLAVLGEQLARPAAAPAAVPAASAPTALARTGTSSTWLLALGLLLVALGTLAVVGADRRARAALVRVPARSTDRDRPTRR